MEQQETKSNETNRSVISFNTELGLPEYECDLGVPELDLEL